MHIQVTIISRLKAATSKLKAEGRQHRGRVGEEKKVKRETDFFLISTPPLTSCLEQSGQKALGKRKIILLLKCETVPERSSPSRAAVINSERLLLHQAIWLRRKEFSSCCWAQIPVGSHSPQPHYSLTTVIAPFPPAPIAAVCESLYLFAGSLLPCLVQKWLCQEPPGSQEAAPSHEGCSGARLALLPIVPGVGLEGGTLQKLLDRQPGTDGFCLSPAGRAQPRSLTGWESHATD